MSQDRIRLKLNPPNVAVPSGSRDLYVNSDGVLVQESPGGTIEVVGPLTSASVLTLLEDQNLEVSGLTLGDQGNVIQNEAELLIRNGNSLAISDAENPGGSIIYDESRSYGSTRISASEYASTSVRKVIGSIVVPARYAVEGAILQFFGGIEVFSNGSNLPAGVQFGCVTEERKLLTGNTEGSIFGTPLAASVYQFVDRWSFRANLDLAVDTSKVYLNGVSNPVKRPCIHSGSGSDVTVSASAYTVEDQSFGDESSRTPIGSAFRIYFVLEIPQSASPSVAIEVSHDLTVRGV